ncbi:hypothetical protein NBRC116602_10750 [Hyphomicrobiales bacterium 4NK60-0047b]
MDYMEKNNLKKNLILPLIVCGVFSSIFLSSLVSSEASEADAVQDRLYFDYPPKLDFVNDDVAKKDSENEPASETKKETDLSQEPISSEKDPLNNETKDKPETKVSAETYTVALVVMPLQADGSAWDVTAGADLVLCGAAGCTISNGLEKAAIFYEGGSGLRLIKKAGACRDSLACVFRDVDFAKLVSDKNALIEPVDVDYVSHTYMGGITYKTFGKTNPLFSAENCSLKKTVLDCKTGVHKRDYSLWVLPEKLARLGGKEALDAVLFKSLLHQRASHLTAQLLDHRSRVQASTMKFYKTLFEGDIGVSLNSLDGCVLKPEFLSETFYVLGLADASERKAEALLIDLVGRLPKEKARGLVQRTPQFFWAFGDLTQQLEDFANANRYTLDKEKTGVLLRLQAPEEMQDKTDLKDNKVAPADEELSSEKTELVYGWQVKARAKAALSHCELAN